MAKKVNRRKATIPENESKADRFVRVVTPRVVKAVKAIKVVGYCANASYEYSPKQVKQIIDRLTAAVQSVEGMLTDNKSVDEIFGFAD